MFDVRVLKFHTRSQNMEERVTIPCGEITLDGRFDPAEGGKGVVITHPHPLYGGDMDNPVALAIKNAYTKAGYSTLRFNFRGIGASRGTYDNGIGEQTDVRAAIDFLKAAGIRNIDLGGYSFGAWVISGLSPSPEEINRILLVSPPVAMMDFSEMSLPRLPIRMITGSRDDIAPPDIIEDLLDGLEAEAELTTIDGADHFYSGYLQQLEATISGVIK